MTQHFYQLRVSNNLKLDMQCGIFIRPKGHIMLWRLMSVRLCVCNILWMQLLQFPSDFHETYTGFLPYDVLVHEGWILRFNISV